MSILDLAYPSIPGISLLRLARILRVLRIFNRLRSLRAIINALTASILPVGNAFSVMALVTSVYSIVGSQLFGAADPSLFGDFTTSLYTVPPQARPPFSPALRAAAPLQARPGPAGRSPALALVVASAPVSLETTRTRHRKSSPHACKRRLDPPPLTPRLSPRPPSRCDLADWPRWPGTGGADVHRDDV